MNHSESSFNGSAATELFMQSWAPDQESKAALAVVHGFGEHSGRYMNLVNRLVPAGFTVYGFDHRGHGRSPGQRGHINSWEEFLGDVEAFLTEIRKKDTESPLFLYGHSMGGLLALSYALRHPQGLKGVIASGPALSQPGVSPILLTLSRIMSKLWPSFSIDTKLDVHLISRDEEVVRAYQEDPLVHSMASARLGTELTAAMEWTQAHAGDWRLPLLIVHGGDDKLVPPEGSKRFFDNVPSEDKQRIEYPGTRHEPHNDLDRDKVLEDIQNWLENHL